MPGSGKCLMEYSMGIYAAKSCLKGLRMIDIESKISAVNCTDI